MSYYDERETRSRDERTDDIARALPRQIRMARQHAPLYRELLAGVDAASMRSITDLGALPVLRKHEMLERQKSDPPFGGIAGPEAARAGYIFQSPGPIYEPGGTSPDYWRTGRFLHACGIGKDDIVLNCFSYHFTPAGMMFESGARAVGATVVPAGTGQTALQVRAAADIGVTAYAGTPDFLKVILDRADEMDVDLSRIRKAVVGGGALFASLREEYAAREILCLQCYGTAELGNIAYETIANEPLIVDEGVLVEIVQPGTGTALQPGRVGEVVVTTLESEMPLIRFGTGDLSSVVPGSSPCGRTNTRLSGWRGRADQTTKVKGVFIYPRQVARLVECHRDIQAGRVVITREDEMDHMTVIVETDADVGDALEDSVREIFKLRGTVESCAPGSLPNDGKVIDDRRVYDSG